MLARKILANAIRFLSIDAVQKANSGHPGMPMGMADIAEVLWNDFLKHNPTDPKWHNRDRFVLSNGHGAMLLYSVLHLSGYDLTLQDIKEFRQLHSRTPGHPEATITPGVEVTTGPLGQGLACAVGLALSEKLLANEFNTESHKIIDHYTYCFVGDGCLMEGISHEASSLAGTLGLEKLIVFWDDNGISIDGEIEAWCRDNTPQRFEAYGWNVISDVDGHDPEAITGAIIDARQQLDKPTLICCKTTIGFGSPNFAGKAKTHGAPLGNDEIVVTRKQLDWNYKEFEIPKEIYAAWDAKEEGRKSEQLWMQTWESYQEQYPEKADELSRRLDNQLPANWDLEINGILAMTQEAIADTATRKSSKNVLDTLSGMLPELLGGSADLTGSNLTAHANNIPVLPKKIQGNYIYYGVREFAMSAIMNGIALHGGFIPYGGTFLTFSDYARNAIRMSALMKQRVIFVYSHDSIGLGEDGPTHQPIEHLTMLRVTPGVHVWRPSDSAETVVAWQKAIERKDGPTCIALSRQTTSAQLRSANTLKNISKGGYILQECSDFPEMIFIATGSEVGLAVQAADTLNKRGYKIRVVSMPCLEVFENQPPEYRAEVLPEIITNRIVIEAGSRHLWHRLAGASGCVLGIDSFGESAPCKDVYDYFGLTVEGVIAAAQSITANNKEKIDVT